MWLANFEDGSSVGGGKCHWTDLPKDKKITGVQLVNPNSPTAFISLKNYHRYYFAKEAVAMMATGPNRRAVTNGEVVAEILGGHDTDLGVGTEIRMETSGAVKIRTYPLEKYKFTEEILRIGRKLGRPSVEGPAQAHQVVSEG